MSLTLILLLIGIPIVEIFVFITVGGTIGLFNTLSVIFITAAIGVYLLRNQGLNVLNRVRETLDANQLPVDEIFDGIFLLIAGTLLLTPGFVTDSAGFLLFIPPFRMLLCDRIVKLLKKKGHLPKWGTTNAHQPQSHPQPDVHADNIIIDGKFEEVEPNRKKISDQSSIVQKDP